MNADQAQRPRWRDDLEPYGPASFLGAASGLLCDAIGVVFGDPMFFWPYWIPLGLGLLHILVPGPVRRFAVGLLIASTALPVVLLGVFVGLPAVASLLS